MPPVESTAPQSGVQAEIMILHPVGTIKNDIKEPILKSGEEGIKIQGSRDEVNKKVREIQQGLSEITIHPDLAGILDDIEEYSHIVVLYWAHKTPQKSRSLTKVHPMGRQDIPVKGLYATCSPARPNPVLMTVVKLVRRNENVLTVAGLDAIDGSPVLDIKPYVGDFYPQEDVRVAGWMRRLMAELAEGGQ